MMQGDPRAHGDAATAKKALREAMRARLARLPPLVRAQEEELVNAALQSLPEWPDAGTLLLFKAKAPELSVVAATNAAWRQGKRVCLPRVEGPTLTLHEVRSWDDLAPGAFGIHEPVEGTQRLDPAAVDLAVLPGLAWTLEGRRLGQGGGFYDRLLATMEAPGVGVGFSCQLVEEVPWEPHDRGVGRVVTPQHLTT